MSKVLVTGATSSLGAHIVRILLETGYQVRVFARRTSNISIIQDLNIEIFYGDIALKEDLDRAVKGCNYVIHAAANIDMGSKSQEIQTRENVSAVENLLSACLQHEIKRLVYVSTANTIAPGSKDQLGNEKNTIGKQYEKLGYAKSKLLAEELIRQHVKEKGLDAVIVNPSFMIGPYDTKPTSNRIILMLYRKKINFLPAGGKSFVYVKDAAAAACNALKMGKAGENYLLTGENLTYREFCRKVEEVTGTYSLIIILPRTLMLFIGTICTFLNLLGMKIELTRTNAAILCTHAFYSHDKAVNELGMPETPITTGIREAIKWFGENKYF
jgi:dihydroflavonol-4-reductase